MTAPTTSAKNPPWYISGAAGALGQLTELTIAGQVLSRIATEQQAHPKKSIIVAISDIYKKNGSRAFFEAWRWNAGMSICKGFTRWSINNFLFSFFGDHIPKEVQKKHTWVVPVIVGLGGAAFETTVYLCPLESLKTREMTENWVGKKRMWSVIRSEGISIFFKGWTGLFPRQGLTWATYLLAYDKYRDFVMAFREGKPARTADKFAMNFMTGATAAVLTTPLDLYKTQRQKVNPIQEKTMWSAMRALFQSYGWRGIFNSLRVRILRSGGYAVATFTVMDWCNALPARMKV